MPTIPPHGRISTERPPGLPSPPAWPVPPSIEVVDTDYGMLIGAQREAEAGQCYWRITQFHMPFYTMPPTDTTPDPVLHTHIWIPVDDAHLVEDVSEVLVCYALWVYESLSTLHPNRVTP